MWDMNSTIKLKYATCAQLETIKQAQVQARVFYAQLVNIKLAQTCDKCALMLFQTLDQQMIEVDIHAIMDID